MTEMRSRAWREEWHVTEIDMDDRLDEAALVIDTMGSFYPINITIDAGVFSRSTNHTRCELRQGRTKTSRPPSSPNLSARYANPSARASGCTTCVMSHLP